jgi:hypothetical protein
MGTVATDFGHGGAALVAAGFLLCALCAPVETVFREVLAASLRSALRGDLWTARRLALRAVRRMAARDADFRREADLRRDADFRARVDFRA